MPNILASLLFAVLISVPTVHAGECLKAVAGPPPGYDHNKFGVEPSDHIRRFSAYTVSFDGEDDDDGDGKSDLWRVPEWVAYELRRGCHRKSGGKPRRWCHDASLEEKELAARDRAYRYSREFRKKHPDWYTRGHLAMRYHAVRISHDAEWNTYTTLNAVPQRQSFNAGSWQALECLTGAWANRYRVVWIVTGPIFDDGKPSAWIGEPEKNERQVAVPDRLFKVVIRNDDGLKVLAFIARNATEMPDTRPSLESTRKSVREVEALTELTFTGLPDSLKSDSTTPLWSVGEVDFLKGCHNRKRKIE